MTSSSTPPIRPIGLHEIVLEVADLPTARQFYTDVIGLPVITEWTGDREAVWLDLGDGVALGLWTVATGGDKAIAGGRGGAHVHFAIRIPHGTIDLVARRLAAQGIPIVDRVTFDDRNESLYVDDPDGNCVELMDAIADWAGNPLIPEVPEELAQERNGYLETTGRISGEPRITEIWFVVEDGAIFLLSGIHTRKDWVRNLTVQPRVRFRLGDRWYKGVAQLVADDPALADRVRQGIAAKYHDGEMVDWIQTGTPVAISIIGEGTSA